MHECMGFRDISALVRKNFVNISLSRFPDSTTVKSVYICNKTGKMILCIKLQADSNFTGR